MELTSDRLTMAENKIVMMYILDKTRRSISYKVYLELVTSLSDINYFDFHSLLQILINDEYIESIQENRKVEQKIYNSNINEAEKLKNSFLENSEDIEIDENESKNEKLDFSTTREEKKISKQVDINKHEREKSNDEKVTLYKLTEKGKEALKLALSILPGITKLRVDNNFNKYYKIIREEYSVLAEYLPADDLVVCKIVEDDKTIFKIEMNIKSIAQTKNIIRNWKSKADEYYLDILKTLSEDVEEDDI